MHSTHPDRKAPARRFATAARLGFAVVASLVGAGFGATACLDRPLCDKDCRPRTTNIFVDTITQKSVDKIDLLFLIDNSISMADKQAVLAEAVPDLVKRLVNPYCVDADGKKGGAQPADPTGGCDTGYAREFQPIKDIHIGVITSSIGGHGSELCQGSDVSNDLRDQEENDHAHLIATRPRFQTEIQKYPGGQAAEPTGFLDWNPGNGKGDITAFNTTFQAMTTASSEFGCGLEAQLESIYRFIADPVPPKSIATAACPGSNQPCAVPTGTDEDLLAQRAAFLRPDSLVSIIMVTDENDCSIRDTAQFYYAARQDITLPPGSQACLANPNDPCCYSCATAAPAGCTADPTCEERRTSADWQNQEQLNLRCYQQKKRFGLDFLYPTARYVNAFSQSRLCVSRADLAVEGCPDADGVGGPDIALNPLFNGVSGMQSVPRDPSLVFLAGIVGVPWQDIQAKTDKDGNPYTDPSELHYLTATELRDQNIWSVILGDPNPGNGAGPIPPTDTLMIEQVTERQGVDGQGTPLAPSNANSPQANPVNGHEWVNAGDDLQYACIFKLKTDRNCSDVSKMPDPQPGCDCKPKSDGSLPDTKNPLCQQDNGSYGFMQRYAKAFPGTRELQVLKDFGSNSIVASICARNLGNDQAQDYGYRPAVDAIVDRLKEALTGRCLPRKLVPDASGKIPCSVLEVRPPNAEGCDPSRGRLEPDPRVVGPAQARLREAGFCDNGPIACASLRFCELQEAGPECHQSGAITKSGWCYVDPAIQPQDDPILVDKCPASERRIMRFVDGNGGQTPASDARVMIACFGAQLDDEGAPAQTAAPMAPAPSTPDGG